MITDKNGVKFFAWELNRKEIDRRMHSDYNAREIGSDEWVEAYDWQIARMHWLKANVRL